MKNCFIFSGQGSHRPGMSLNLYNTFQIAKDRIELSNKIKILAGTSPSPEPGGNGFAFAN